MQDERIKIYDLMKLNNNLQEQIKTNKQIIKNILELNFQDVQKEKVKTIFEED